MHYKVYLKRSSVWANTFENFQPESNGQSKEECDGHFRFQFNSMATAVSIGLGVLKTSLISSTLHLYQTHASRLICKMHPPLSPALSIYQPTLKIQINFIIKHIYCKLSQRLFYNLERKSLTISAYKESVHSQPYHWKLL